MFVHHLALVPRRFSSIPFAAGAPIATWFESRGLLLAIRPVHQRAQHAGDFRPKLRL